MLKVNFWLRRLIKEWLFLSSFLGLLITSVYLRRIPDYSNSDFRILFIISMFLIVLKGLENSNILTKIAQITSEGKFTPLKLILLSAFLSMFITNDIALIMIVPITLIMDLKHKDIIVILEAISANAASAFLPSGNPQNMFIYWFYNLNLFEFIKAIYPFTLISMILIIVAAIVLGSPKAKDLPQKEIKKNYNIYLILLLLMLAVLFKFLPSYLGLFVILYALFFDKESLKIDYFLIGIFFMFFGFTDNLKHIVHISIKSQDGVFVFSALLSQIMSNVPSTLMLADFTNNWRQLLWGASVGGYGNLIGSLANLIAYRIYVSYNKKSKNILIKFTVIGYLFFAFMFIFKLFIFDHLF